MQQVWVSRHAIERYQRRVEAVSDDEARRRLSCPSILGAANAGAQAVLLPSGHRVIIDHGNVITVTPRHKSKRRVR